MNHDDDDATPAWLRPAREELARRQPAAEQDAAVLTRLVALQRTQRPRGAPASRDAPGWLRGLAWSGGALGATAALLLCAMLLLDPPGGGSGGQARAATPAGSGFIPLVPEGELRDTLAAGRSAAVWLQPAELPRERLALLGLPFDAARADEPVRAELMLNPSGRVLAVRILN